jgi:SAM-dependent methyltransferase
MVDDDPAPTTGDAFGRALRTHHDGGHGYVIVERDDGLVSPSAGAELYFGGPDEWPERERRAVDGADGRILDVGCGAGRHALALQERGHDVTAIDVSEGAVEVARDRGVDDARVLDVTDVADELDGAYDTVLMLGNNFGLVGTEDRAASILRGLADVTAADGRLLAESRDPTATDADIHLAYHERNRERGRLPGAVRQRIRFETVATPWHDYLHAAPDTMRDLTDETPWTVADIVDGEGGSYVGDLRIE